MRINNMTFIGTSHVAEESIQKVESTIKRVKPAIVAIELDKSRFLTLFSKKKRSLGLKDIAKLGLKGFMFNAVGAWIEKKLGKMVGTSPGDEMRAGVKAARDVGAKVALIDQDITITLKRLSKSITWKEKWMFFVSMIQATFKSEAQQIDLRKVPSKKIIKKLSDEVQKKYPTMYKVLVEERNEVMAKNLYKLVSTHKDEEIVVVIGAGHVDDIIALIKKWK